jgi:hypothetical protein
VSQAGVEPATYRLGGWRAKSLIAPYDEKNRYKSISLVLLSSVQC